MLRNPALVPEAQGLSYAEEGRARRPAASAQFGIAEEREGRGDAHGKVRMGHSA